MLRWCDVSHDPPKTLADDWLAQREKNCSTCVHRVPYPSDPGALYCEVDGPRWPKGVYCGLWRVAITEVQP
jgi:hypothetical protein